MSLQWRHNGRNGVSNNHPHNYLLNRLFRRRSKNISKLRVTGLCAGNSPVTGEFPAQRASEAENVSIWWRYHEKTSTLAHGYCATRYKIFTAPVNKLQSQRHTDVREVSVRRKEALYVETDSHAYKRKITQHENGMYIGKSRINVYKRSGIYVVNTTNKTTHRSLSPRQY